MQPLSGLDASFLYLETPTSHMHVGGVAVLEGSLKFEEFRNLLASRIHLSPKMRQRLIQVPLSIDYPYWADDPNFDINLHLQHLALPKPGAWRQLRDLASNIFSKPLDRSRPLWEFTFVEGLNNIPQVPAGSVAIIGKIHHAAVDGVAGADLLALLFDLTPEPRKVKPPEPFNPDPLPNEITVATQSAINFAKKPLKLPGILKDTVSATLKAGFLTRVQNIDLPAVPFTAPATPLNGIISAQRKWNTAILSLDRVKTLKNIMGTTLNDVMLAICSGALRRYLLDKDKLPHKPLVAMVPISVRAPDEEDKSGNQISSMLVQLATHIEDPLERLETVHENAIRGKMYQGAIGARTLAKMAEVVPFGLANQATRLYSRFQVAEMHNPIFNVVITNVPGPQFPLYMNGRKLLAHMGMAPIIDGMGLIITIFSYNGLITVSPTSDANTMPDIDVFARYLREAANELETAVLQYQAAQEAEKPTAAESDALFEHMHQYLQDNPDFLRPGVGLFQFNIIGPVENQWQIDLNEAPGRVTRGAAEKPDATLTIRDDHLMRIAHGELDLQIAFVQGRLKVKGDMDKALKLGGVMSKIPSLPVTA